MHFCGAHLGYGLFLEGREISSQLTLWLGMLQRSTMSPDESIGTVKTIETRIPAIPLVRDR